MASDVLDIGPTPCGEPCEQVGENYRPERAKAECRAYINQLRRMFGEPPEGARFVITSNPHDYGTYYDVGVRFSDSSDAACDFAYRVEEGCPDRWDDEAKTELGIYLSTQRPHIQ